MKKAVIVVFDKFTDVDVFLPWDLLNRARFRQKDFEVKLIGTGARHRSVNGIDLAMQGGIAETVTWSCTATSPRRRVVWLRLIFAAGR